MTEIAVPFNDLTRYAALLWERCAPRWEETVRTGRVILGTAVSGFERDFAAYIAADHDGHTVGVANGTDALELALRSVGVTSGSTVVTAANAGFYASTAIRGIGATPLYVDIADGTVTPDAPSIEVALVAHPVDAVVLTHLYGRLADDVHEIAARCRSLGVPLVEDCSQSHGARSGGVMSGGFGDVAAFSFYPTKNLGALGDAGALFTTSAEIADRARALRQYGWGAKYLVERDGGRNSRLDEIQAIVLDEALLDLEARNEARRSIVDTYVAAAPSLDLVCIAQDRERWVGHLCVAQVDDRARILNELSDARVATDIHFPVPDHLQPVMRDAGCPALPNTEALAGRVLSLPCFPEMTDAEIGRVADVLARVFP
ncbi:MAG: erythromycin biosynthesis sensory transduction protein eryC1 [Ilumatobacteraceae bacterium]|nr:erythromycin biosynthesis sensory transduction protein eryC1 [Ilumatobacteraceae bacterium]